MTPWPRLQFLHRRFAVKAALSFIVVFTFAFICRHAIIRGYIAYRIYAAHVLAPSTNSGRWTTVQFFWDVAGLRMQRDQRAQRFEPQLKPLVKQISERQAQGRNAALSLQIYREVRWWINFTADDAHTKQRISELAASLSSDTGQKVAEQQLPDDGSWGAGYTVWFMKLFGTVNDALAQGAVPRYPLHFLDPVNSPERLTAHLNDILHDKFTVTGAINRQELDETVSALARLLLGDVPTTYPFHPQLKDAFVKFIDDSQNPATGCWGVWFVGRDGTVWRQDDVGITFHIVSDTSGAVKHLDRVARRVLELSTVDFPAGIRMKGHYENHLNYDVVKIFKLAWPSLDEGTRRSAAAELSRMVNWCLTESYQRDGTFKVSDLDDTTGDAIQYGIYFLREAGFFRKSERFWTDQDFPQAKAIHAQLKARLEAIGLSGTELGRAYKKLGDKVD